MMKHILFLICMAPNLFYAQNDLRKVGNFPLDAQSVWQIDVIGNLYVAKKDLLIKYDTSGVKLFSQSLKSSGRIDAILPINTMKIVLFSEQQQSFTLMDNTLSEAIKTYDLSELGFGYVHAMAVSAQPNKFWIYDQSNSKLVLLDLNRTQQQQEITNLRGILNVEEVNWIKEENNKLYLFNKNSGLYVFDLYGTLLNYIELPEVDDVQTSNGVLFTLKKGQVYRFTPEDASFEKVKLPLTDILAFQWVNDTFFVRTKEELSKYRFYL